MTHLPNQTLHRLQSKQPQNRVKQSLPGMLPGKSIRLGKLTLSVVLFCLSCNGLLFTSPPGAAQEPDSIVVADSVSQAQAERVAAIAKAVPAAVSVFVPGGAGGGSGVLISADGYALTNFHVSSPAGSYMRCGLSDGNIYDAVIVGIDPVGDLALIKLLGRDDFPFAELGNSDLLQPGQWCFVVGNPFLLATNLQPTVTWGMLSGVRRYQYPAGTLLEYADCLQTDASINPGNSGGPLFDAPGRLIGIVGRASFEKRGRVNVGVGYAISINQAKNFLGYLKSGRIVDHATLGATVVTDPDGGVRVSNILESSDAYRRGLSYNDEIIEIAGRDVFTANDVKNILGTLPKGWRVPVTFVRDGKRREILVRLPGVHGQDELLEKMGMVLPPPPPVEPGKAPQGDVPAEDEQSDPPQEETDKSAELKGADGRPVPPPAAAMIKARRGFANYYFNYQQQQLLVDKLRQQSPVGQVDAGRWLIRGTIDGGNAAELTIRVDKDLQQLDFDQKQAAVDSASERFDAVDQKLVTSLLPPLEAYRRLLQLGADQFGEVVYWGQAPFLGQFPQRHVLIGIHGELEYRFLIHPESFRLEAIEVFADRARDPAELIIQWPAEDLENARPEAFELRFGTDVLLRMRVEQWSAESSAG